jgi:hypothetical protein
MPPTPGLQQQIVSIRFLLMQPHGTHAQQSSNACLGIKQGSIWYLQQTQPQHIAFASYVQNLQGQQPH